MSPSIERVAAGVLKVRLGSWRGATLGYDVNAYVIDGVLIDTGPPLARRVLLEAVAALKLRGAIVTHWHEDHAGNVPVLAAMGLPLAMHRECEAMLRERPSIRPYRRVIWGRSPRLTEAVTTFDAAPLQLIASPGHCEDHLVVWDADRRVLASGDLFLGVQVRVAHEHESPRALLTSLRVAAALEPRLLLDAHRGVVRDAAAALRAKIDWTEETIGRIEQVAASGLGARAIVRQLFRGESFAGWASGGEYSRAAFVRAVLRESNAALGKT